MIETYSEYHLNPEQFSFLKSFQDCWQEIRDEFTNFMNQASQEELNLAYDVMGPKTKTIKTKGEKKYSAFGILFQSKFIEAYIKEHQITYPNLDSDSAAAKALALREKYFLILANTIAKVNLDLDEMFISVHFIQV